MPRTQPLLLQVFFTFDAGGAQVRFVQLANHFRDAFRYALIAMDGRYGCAEKLAPGVEVGYWPVTPIMGRMIANRGPFRRLLAEIRPDLLVTHNWGTLEWALANIPRIAPHIHIEDGFGPDESERQIPRRVWTRRLALRNSVVVLPSLNLHRIAREIWRLPESCLRYIPNGIDCGRFDVPPDQSRTSHWPGEGPVIGIVCALRAEKNVARLLRAFAMVAKEMPCRLVIVGEGAERPLLETLTRELQIGGRVIFAGHVRDPERLYGAFEIFALSSDTEQMPYTVLEAMAAGRAIVATDVGDIRHMVAPENQPFLVARDESAFAGALRALLTDDSLRRRIGEANRIKARTTYDQQKMFDAYAALYRAEIGAR